VAGTVLALAAVPLIVVLAAAVCVSLRTWRPFFFQQRVGRAGRRFTVPKLRTLPASAPADADKYALAAIRTTRLASALRRTHLDELPQLLLVPTGRMSLVGPRPEMPRLLDQFDRAFVAARCSVRPGCSGLWQVSRDAHKLIGEAPEYDLYYLSNGGLRLDLWILWCSALALTGRRPLVTCADVPAWAQPRRSSGERRVASPSGGAINSSISAADSVSRSMSTSATLFNEVREAVNTP